MENLNQPVELKDDDISEDYKELDMSFKVEENEWYIRALEIKEDAIRLTKQTKKFYDTGTYLLIDDITNLDNVITRLEARFAAISKDEQCSSFYIAPEIKLLKKVKGLMEYVEFNSPQICEGCETIITDADYHLTHIYDNLLSAYTKITYPSKNDDESDYEIIMYSHTHTTIKPNVLDKIVQLENEDPNFVKFKFDPYILYENTDKFTKLFPTTMSIAQITTISNICRYNVSYSYVNDIYSNIRDYDYGYTIKDFIKSLNRAIKLLQIVIRKICYKYSIFIKVEKGKRFEIKTDMQILKTITRNINIINKDIIDVNNNIKCIENKAKNYRSFIFNKYLNYYLKTIDQHLNIDYLFLCSYC